MIETQFIHLLSGLDKRSLKQFKQFMNSAFFGIRAQTQDFFHQLHSTHSKWHPLYLKWLSAKDPEVKADFRQALIPYLGKAELSQTLYPNEPYNDPRMRRVASNCKSNLLEFIRIIAPKNQLSQYNQTLALLRYHLQRGEYKQFEAQLKEVRKQRDKIQYRDHEFFYYSFMLEELNNDFNIRAGIRQYSHEKMIHYLDVHFILYKLRMFCAMSSIGRQIGKPFRMSMLKELSAYIQQHNFLDEPLIHIYYLILQLENGETDPDLYPNLLQLLSEQRLCIPPSEVRQIYGFLYNYLERENRKSGGSRSRETFELFHRMEAEGTIYSEGLITQTYFDICVRVACRVGEYDWAEDFIYANEDRIAGENSTEAFDYNLLTLLFNRGEFREVTKRIDRLNLKGIRYQVRRRILKLKAFYEVGDAVDFFNHCTYLKRFLKSKEEIGPTDEVFYANFCRLAEKLGKLRFDQKGDSLELAATISQTRTTEKDWLLAKVGELG